MNLNKLDKMIKGWVVGNFNPSVYKTDNFEVAIKEYNAGDYEQRHFHKVATEITVISKGKVKMNGQVFSTGDIITINPGESTDFEVLDDTITTVIKFPSVNGDKYLVE